MNIAAYPRARYAWYVVALLSIANALSFVARTILSLLVDPVRADLHVSDTAISVLQGFSFALIFAVIGLPISVLADRGNRRNLIALSILLWSVMTAFCGASRTYVVLFFGRLGAGAGEGGFAPASYSIMADYFPPNRLPTAVGVHSMGIFIGIGVALLLGGWITQWAIGLGMVTLPLVGPVTGWQIAFFLAGGPGILLALVFYSTVREPARVEDIKSTVPSDASGWAALWDQFKAQPGAYTGLILGFSLHVVINYGTSTWTPAFLGRQFGLSPVQIGSEYGVATVVTGLAGAFVGGNLSSRLRRGGLASANAWICTLAYGGAAITGVTFFWLSSAISVIAVASLMNILASAAVSCGFAGIQEITPNRMRARMAAVFLFFINALGTGAGPTLVALLGDHVFSGNGALGQGIALTCCLVGPAATALLGIAIRHYPSIPSTIK